MRQWNEFIPDDEVCAGDTPMMFHSAAEKDPVKRDRLYRTLIRKIRERAMSSIFPIILIVLDVGAAVVYAAADGDWRRFIYWIAAAVLTATVTF